MTTDPEGIEHLVKGLLAYCRKHNLNASSMSALANKRKGHHQHKGYRCRKVMKTKMFSHLTNNELLQATLDAHHELTNLSAEVTKRGLTDPIPTCSNM